MEEGGKKKKKETKKTEKKVAARTYFGQVVFSGAVSQSVSQSDVQPSTAKVSQPFRGGRPLRPVGTLALHPQTPLPQTPVRSSEGWGAVYAQLHPPISQRHETKSVLGASVCACACVR